jgi:hypothetical protein
MAGLIQVKVMCQEIKPQAYNCKDLGYANRKNEFEGGFLPQTIQKRTQPR